MTTSTIAAVIDQSSDAGFRTWVAEVIHELVTTCGLTQTSDTGQINTTTVTRQASTGTAAGYVILRFNDTLQSTSPIFIKLEFGTGATTLVTPAMWITVGTGSNGSGTISGTTSGKCPIAANITPASTTAVYVSRYCYSATMGAVCMVNKMTSGNGAAAFGYFFLGRSTDSTGAPSADAYLLIANAGAAATGASNTQGNAINYSYNTSALVANGTASLWSFAPYNLTTTLVNGNVQLGAVWHLQPTVKVSGNIAIALRTEFPDGATITIALLGSSTYTFICTGLLSNSGSVGGNTGYTMLMPWQ
jgi:hypothetical protein